MKIEQKVLDGLKKRFNNVHPLIFHRSAEKAISNGDFFDILDTIPDALPIVWSDEDHKWVETKDITQSENFE